jgi:hypothetical protein
MADERTGGQLERWVSFATTIVAPATVLSALLFYFGYVSSRAQYEYFGVDVDTIGLSTQDYVIRSPQPLLVPLLLLTLLGIGAMLLHASIGQRIAGTAPDVRGPLRLAQYRRLARRVVIVGLVVLGAGIALLLSYPYLREWTLFNLVTPLLLAIGAALVAYAWRIQTLLYPPSPPAATTNGGLTPAATAHADSSMVALRRSAIGLIFVVIVANIFWATATVAQWSGRGLAHYDAAHLDRLPSVILDTQERLYLRSPGVEETVLPTAQGQTFHYRYRHLRLLIEGHDRMFLVPDRWSASDSTLIVRLDGSVRVQFQFQNEAP